MRAELVVNLGDAVAAGVRAASRRQSCGQADAVAEGLTPAPCTGRSAGHRDRAGDVTD